MDAKAGASEKLRVMHSNLVDLSHRIHANPELGFEERLASTWLCEMLADAGFKVDAGVCDLADRVHRARRLWSAACRDLRGVRFSSRSIGHACGHNIIAATAVGAGIAAAKVADDAGLTVSVFGTPAEEIGDGGGKVLMLERGAFEGIHAAMMVHPSPVDTLDLSGTAITTFDVHYTGKEAHAAAFPNSASTRSMR